MSTLKTRPEPLELDFARSAVVVVDMQNAFAAKGGLLDLAGVDIAGAAAVVRTIDGVRSFSKRDTAVSPERRSIRC